MTVTSEDDLKPLNQLQFAAKDFPSYFDALLRLLREQYGAEYNDFSASSTGMLLTHIMAYGLSQLSWQLDRTANDCFLETARTPSTVGLLARQIGYKPNPAAASTVDLSLTFPATIADAIIGAGFQFAGPGGLMFLATSDVLVSAGSTSATVNATEGLVRVIAFTSSGLPNQLYRLTGVLAGKYVADSSVEVYVDGLEWTENDFIDFEKTNQFEVAYSSDPPTVRFGDGFAGNVPPKGAAIRIQYRIISGANGNVRSGTISRAVTQFLVAGDPVTLVVNNPVGSSGGSNPESMQSVKLFAPKAFLSRGAAITQSDYISLTQGFSDATFGSVSVAYADVIRTLGVDATTQGLLSSLISDTVTFQTGFDTQAAIASVEIAQSIAETAAITTTIALVQAELVTIAGEVTTINGLVTVGITAAATVVGNLNEITTLLAGAVSDINSTNYANALTKLSRAQALTAQASASGSECSTQFNSIRGSVITIDDSETEVSGTLLVTLGNSASAVSANNTAISGALTLIDGYADVLNTAIVDDTTALSNHLAGLFSADCKANLVNVPILVKDSEGFYVGPSSGLIRSVQTYLDGIKDVSHQVRVVSGVSLLLYANVVALIEVRRGFVESEVLSQVEQAIEDLLKARSFATPLYLSDIYRAISPTRVSGIFRANVNITAPVDRLDSEGNLIPGQLEIITRGTLTVSKV
jgi:hypothetical protein